MAREEALSGAEAEALRELAEIAVMLKKSGLLGWIRAFIENGDKLVEAFTSEYGLFRALGMIEAVNAGICSLDTGEFIDARMNTEKAMKCLFKALSEADPSKTPRTGLIGLAAMMRDRDVQKGLGYLLFLAKAVGACMGEYESKAKQS